MMKEFVLLLLFCQVTSPVTHTLKNIYTASSEVPSLPEFVIVGMVDDVQVVYYDSNTQSVAVTQDWMSQVTMCDPQYLLRNTGKAMSAQMVFNNNMDIAKQRFNQTGGVHIIQWMYGCEWDDETGDTDGFNQYGYDGEDFISFDWRRETWVSPTPQGFITKLRWDQDKAGLASLKHYFNNVCIEWLKKYVNYGKHTLQRTERPSVSFLQKTPSSPVRCHATGFYPDRVIMFWAKDGEELQENMDHGETLPNPDDGTFQMSVDLDLTSVKHEDWKQYDCVFQLAGIKEDLKYTLDRELIKTNWGKPGMDTTTASGLTDITSASRLIDMTSPSLTDITSASPLTDITTATGLTDTTTASRLTDTILKASGIVLMLLIALLLIRGHYALWKVIRPQRAAVDNTEMDYVNVAGSRAEARQREQAGVQAGAENIEMDYVNDAASRAGDRLSKEAGDYEEPEEDLQ